MLPHNPATTAFQILSPEGIVSVAHYQDGPSKIIARSLLLAAIIDAIRLRVSGWPRRLTHPVRGGPG
jgi:hypothetical protein